MKTKQHMKVPLLNKVMVVHFVVFVALLCVCVGGVFVAILVLIFATLELQVLVKWSR